MDTRMKKQKLRKKIDFGEEGPSSVQKTVRVPYWLVCHLEAAAKRHKISVPKVIIKIVEHAYEGGAF